MKRKLFLRTLVCFLFGVAFAFAMTLYHCVSAKPTRCEKISCGKILFDGEIQMFETLECGEEQEFIENDNDIKVYSNKVSLTKQFKKRVKENIYDVKAEIRQEFTFVYDKVDRAEISPENISSEVTITNWKISPLTAISIDDGICSVSNQYRVYDKNFIGNFQYMCDGYFEIFCDSNGNIGISSDVR